MARCSGTRCMICCDVSLQGATARRLDALDTRTNELVALVAKVAEGVVQLQERQEGIADTLSQLRGSLPSSEQDGRAFGRERAAADAAPSICM
jgi:phage gp36-like protein